MAHTWQYQLIRHEEEDRVWFGLHEVYYKEGEPWAWTDELFAADTVEELIEQLEMMLDDIRRSPIMIENGDKLERYDPRSPNREPGGGLEP